MIAACKRCGGAGCDWCILPESLRDRSGTKRPCEVCGKKTPGTHAGQIEYQDPVTGLLAVRRAHLCAACDKDSSTARARARYQREREHESRQSGLGRS